MRRAAIAGSLSVALVLVLVLILSGKSVPVGTFRGERALSARPGADPVVVEQARRVVMTVREGGWADLEDGGVPWEGQLSRSGDTLNFEVYALGGINIQKQAQDLPRRLQFTVLPNGHLRFGEVELVRDK